MVLLRQKEPLEIFIKRSQFVPASRFLACEKVALGLSGGCPRAVRLPPPFNFESTFLSVPSLDF